MAQLTDDYAATRPVAFDAIPEKIAAIMSRVTDIETVALALADGRVLAEDVVSRYDLPPFPNSAVDGYAVKASDLADTRVFPVVGRIVAGSGEDRTLAPATAMRIFTGAWLPAGADTVFMQEDVELRGDAVVLPAGLAAGSNTRRAGEDICRGAVALPSGRRLRPQDLALAAALGVESLKVARRLRVALFSTGDEIVDPGTAPGAAQRFDSNRMLLSSLLARAGAGVTDLGILPDDRAIVGDMLEAAEPGHDLILTTGGVSVGEEDHVKDAVADKGTISFWRLAIKPGRPIAIGRVGAVPFVGLPGNPVAAFVTFARIVRPMLAHLSGETYAQAVFSVEAAFTHRKRKGPREYLRVSITTDAAGTLVATKHPVEGAAILTSLTQTQGLVELGEDITEVHVGDRLAYFPYPSLL